MTSSESRSKASVLIVDDAPANLQLLAGILKGDQYTLRAVPSGALALAAAETLPPDLILLDITMPDMDGYEVCQRLKRNPTLAPVPIIFISALSETLDKVRAFEAGGVDYVTKPFQAEEVRARVRTHLSLRALQKDLETRYEELRKLQELRDNLTDMIVHDLRSPLTSVMGYLDLLNADAAGLGGDFPKFVTEAYDGSTRMAEMINSLLDVTRLEAGEMPLDRQNLDLSAVAVDAAKSLGGLMIGRDVQHAAPDGAVVCQCDGALIRRVVANLLGNALKFTPATAPIAIRVTRPPAAARIELQDAGPGIAAEDLPRIFDKFGQGAAGRKKKRSSSGLGLAFCKLAVEAHGGRIGVESVVGRGTTFWFELPA
jgi:two-component system sensor histidine kinase/response regulator